MKNDDMSRVMGITAGILEEMFYDVFHPIKAAKKRNQERYLEGYYQLLPHTQ